MSVHVWFHTPDNKFGRQVADVPRRGDIVKIDPPYEGDDGADHANRHHLPHRVIAVEWTATERTRHQRVAVYLEPIQEAIRARTAHERNAYLSGYASAIEEMDKGQIEQAREFLRMMAEDVGAIEPRV